MVYRGPGLLENDEGEMAVILFSKDLVKLTILLDESPKNSTYLFQLFLTVLLFSLLLSMLLQYFNSALGGYKIARNKRVKQDAPKRDTSSTVVLPEYTSKADNEPE
jgi:hypothetical protein